jgi:MFS family permease
MPAASRTSEPWRQGIVVNWRQFALQMATILCVGMTLGTERTVLPLLGKQTFHVQSFLVISSFVISFGVVKALLNLAGGPLSERYGRKPVLVGGWISALPIPVILFVAPNWTWVVVANVLLGINQGLAWSMSMNAKIDLAGSGRRGLAVGLDEAGGYGGVAVAALITGYLGGAYGIRHAPFVFAAAVILTGLGIAVFLVRETLPFARGETPRAGSSGVWPAAEAEARLPFGQIFIHASIKDRTMFAINQAGAIEKFVDALAWIALPLYLSLRHVPIGQIGEVVFVYGAVWGLGQVVAGHLADLVGRKLPIVTGMVLCGIGVTLVPLVDSLPAWFFAAGATGLGMALLYPNLNTAAAHASPPSWRATSLGVYRFWRDAGYALGAILIGLTANRWGLTAAFYAVALAMGSSALVLAVAMRETRPAVLAGQQTGCR